MSMRCAQTLGVLAVSITLAWVLGTEVADLITERVTALTGVLTGTP